MEVATILDMDKADGVIKIHGTQTMLEEIGAIKDMGTKVAGASLTAISALDISRVMVVAQ